MNHVSWYITVFVTAVKMSRKMSEEQVAKQKVSLLQGIAVLLSRTHMLFITLINWLAWKKECETMPLPDIYRHNFSFGRHTFFFFFNVSVFCHSKRKLISFCTWILSHPVMPMRFCAHASEINHLTLAGSILKNVPPSCGWTLHRRSSFRSSVQFIKNME